MAKAEGNRVQVILECTEHKAMVCGTSRYITTKNRRTTERLELEEYNPIGDPIHESK